MSVHEFQGAHPARRRSSILSYELSVMFGQYREQLATFARYEAEKAKELEVERKRLAKKEKKVNTQKFTNMITSFQRKMYKIGTDYVMLTALGIIVALLSFLVDIVVHELYSLRNWLYTDFFQKTFHQYIAWTLFTITLIMIAAIICRFISPQAVGSGVSEMKVILRGVVLKEYLSFKTLCAKTFGLPFSLGSGLPLGKEGPFVHISSMVANQLLRFFGRISSESERESRYAEVLAVACAVGVASTFASPVGGVLYSIEIVSVLFSVRSYWQGFFASLWGALLWRLLSVWFNFEENITHIFKTNFRFENPYQPIELIAFAILGLFCGFFAFVFVSIQRQFVLFNRRDSAFHRLLKKYTLLYPLIVTFIIASISFPPGLGQFYGSWLSSEQSMHQLFSNLTWGTIESKEEWQYIDNWRTQYTSVYANSFFFFIGNLVIIALGSTLPVPLGLIVHSFKIGAGFGRFYGEWLAYWFPNGMGFTNNSLPLVVGAYSVAGSAAFAGANTGALSSAVIAFEMTGQLTHFIPILVAVICANILAQSLGPSIYDSIIKLKKLPYLPPIMPSSSEAHKIFVEDFMQKDLLFIWEKATYRYLKHLLNSKKQLRTYPLVKAPDSRILLGTINRFELINLLQSHLSSERMNMEISETRPHSPAPDCPVHGRSLLNVAIPEEVDIEMSTLARHAWEESQLDQTVDLSICLIDPAPFQLVEGTSLMKAHNLFSLLGLHTVYVTSLGRLIGVVSLTEIRAAIDGMYNIVQKRDKTSNESTPLNK